MSVYDYSQTPANNVSISGININENCAPGGINNALRQLLADIATFVAAGGSTGQPLDATLTALAALATSADQMIYATGADAFAMTTLTAAARTLLGQADFASMLSTMGAASAPVVTGTGGSNCAIALGGGLVFTLKDFTAATGTFTHTYGNGYTYSSWARAWMAGDDSNADVSTSCIGQSLTTATIYSHAAGSVACTLFSIGI